MSASRPIMRAAFLDRDGVINVDTGYPHRPAELEFTSTAVAAIHRLNASDVLAIVVTNQSGVARGWFGMADVDAFHAEIQRQLGLAGARIDAFYVSPYHPEGTVAAFTCDHPDRKPGPGMLIRAMADWPIDAGASFLIGDKDSDLAAASAAGIRGVRVPANTLDLHRVVQCELARPVAEAIVPHPTPVQVTDAADL